MYLAGIIICLCISYFVVFKVFSIFFEGKSWMSLRKAILSVIIILAFTCIGYTVTFLIPDLETGNRVLHVFVGGFLCTLICFMVMRDGGFNLTKVQFFIFSLIIVTALGAFNEHLELFLQTYVRFLFYSNPKDTWLDLLSNTIGIVIANAVLLPFVNRSKKLSNTN